MGLEAAVLHPGNNFTFGILLGGLPSIGVPAMGLIVGIYALTFIASLAGTEFNAKAVFVLATVLAAGSWVAFVWALKLQFPVAELHFGLSEEHRPWNCSITWRSGFGVASRFKTSFTAFVGCLLGTLIGVLLALALVATIAMLLPATYALPRWRR